MRLFGDFLDTKDKMIQRKTGPISPCPWKRSGQRETGEKGSDERQCGC